MLLLMNVGVRDLRFDIGPEGGPGQYEYARGQKSDDALARYIADRWFGGERAQAGCRPVGQRLLEVWGRELARAEREEFVRRCEFPMITAALTKTKWHHGSDAGRVVLIATDQNRAAAGKHWENDTLHVRDLAIAVLPAKLTAGTSSTTFTPGVDVTEEPVDPDRAFNFVQTLLDRIRGDLDVSARAVTAIVSGGIPAMNTALLQASVARYSRDLRLFRMKEGGAPDGSDTTPVALDLWAHRRDQLVRTADSLLRRCEYRAVRELLEASLSEPERVAARHVYDRLDEAIGRLNGSAANSLERLRDLADAAETDFDRADLFAFLARAVGIVDMARRIIAQTLTGLDISAGRLPASWVDAHPGMAEKLARDCNGKLKGDGPAAGYEVNACVWAVFLNAAVAATADPLRRQRAHRAKKTLTSLRGLSGLRNATLHAFGVVTLADVESAVANKGAQCLLRTLVVQVGEIVGPTAGTPVQPVPGGELAATGAEIRKLLQTLPAIAALRDSAPAPVESGATEPTLESDIPVEGAAPRAHVVLIETSGNQPYVFSTNKRRENVGASELIDSVARVWLKDWMKSHSSVTDQHVLVAASGKILLIAPDQATAKNLVRFITQQALRKAPGLDVCGVIRPIGEGSNAEMDAVTAVHRDFPAVRNARPGPDERYLRLPVVAECESSGLPANTLRRESSDSPYRPRSAASAARMDAANRAYDRFGRLLGLDAMLAPMLREGAINERAIKRIMDHLAERAEWVAVIHADGNSLGKVFLSLGDNNVVGGDSSRYREVSRGFSDAVQRASEWAFARALSSIKPSLRLGGSEEAEGESRVHAFLPLIVGGDDLTVVCDAQHALPFTHAYLQAFESFALHDHCDEPGDAERASLIRDVLAGVPDAVAGSDFLTACAGVAIVKRHFPFSAAYTLCSELTDRAKMVKRSVLTDGGVSVPCSAIDFHVLYDSSDASLDRIRRGLHASAGDVEPAEPDAARPSLVARPYVTTSLARLARASEESTAWVRRREWDGLVERTAAFRRPLPGAVSEVETLPRSQTHDLREALFLGVGVAEARFSELWQRYPRAAVLAAPDTACLLFTQGAEQVTGFLDALEAVDFLPAGTKP